MHLLSIDYVIILTYFIGVVLIGLFISKYVKHSEDYFLAGRMLPFWAIGMSIVVTDICLQSFVGVSGQAYRFGLAVANFDWIGSFPAMIIAAFIFIPYYWRAGVYTIPEFLGRRYNTAVRTIESLMWIVMIALDLGIVFHACSLFMTELLGWGYWDSVVLTAAVVGIYTVAGGLAAVVLTDVAQLVFMYVGGFAIVGIGLYKVGGWSGLVEKVYALGPQYSRHFDLLLPADTPTPYPWTGILFGLGVILAMAYFVGNQNIVQRTLGAMNEWHAKASMLFGAFLKSFIPILIVTPGLIALALFGGEITDGDKVFPLLIRKLLPPGMTGLMFVAMIAAMMSSVDSMLNSVATLWTKDIYQRFIAKQASDKHLLWMGRVFTVVILIVGASTARLSERFNGLYVYVQTLLSLFQGPTLALLLLGIFWKRCTQWGGLVGLVAGVGSAVWMSFFAPDGFFTIEDPFLYVSVWSFLFAAGITILVSLVTKPHDDERLYGLVYGMIRDSRGAQDVLERRVNA